MPLHTVDASDPLKVLRTHHEMLAKPGSKVLVVGPAGAGRGVQFDLSILNLPLHVMITVVVTEGELTECIIHKYGHHMVSVGMAVQRALKDGTSIGVKARKRIKEGAVHSL